MVWVDNRERVQNRNPRSIMIQVDDKLVKSQGGEGWPHGLIVGVDLVKDEDRLLAAYDDPEGVTAAFNLNLLARLNREARADFDPTAFAHRVRWNAGLCRIEMHLESLTDQVVSVAGRPIRFRAGETIHTENSHKYTPESFARLARRAGWRSRACWMDAARDFSVHELVQSH